MERTRCTYCRNPIKPHQAAAGPDRSYHEDCWPAAQAAPSLTAAEQQAEYSEKIASTGLAAVLAPYVSVFPPEQRTFTAPPESAPPRHERPAAAEAPAAEAAESQAPEAPAQQRREPNFVIVGRS